MANTTINTRIILRNDALSAWNNSSSPLLKGEVGLALHENGSYELRVGTDGNKSWSEIGSSNIIVPASNVSGLTYVEYQLSSLATAEGEQAKFQLCGKTSAGTWTALGTPLTIPEIDLSDIYGRIDELSGAVDTLTDNLGTLSSDVDAFKGEVSEAIEDAKADVLLSALSFADGAEADAIAAAAADAASKADAAKNAAIEAAAADATSKANAAQAAAIAAAAEDAQTKADAALDAAKADAQTKADAALDAAKADATAKADAALAAAATDAQTKAEAAQNAAIAAAATDATGKADAALAAAKKYTDDEIAVITTAVSGGVHFIGSVYSAAEDGSYKLTEDGESTKALNGSLIILDGKEYIWSDALNTWNEFGDEGNCASRQYVNEAKTDAINETKNTVTQYTGVSIDDIDDGVNTGDIAIIKTAIADDKYSHTAYTWDSALSSWEAMDGNYNAENVFFDENITITTAVGNISLSNGQAEIPAAGKNLKQVFESLWTKETTSLTLDRPTVTFAGQSTSGNHEVGEIHSTYPTFTITVSDIGGVGTYKNKDASGAEKSATGITVDASIYTTVDGTDVVKASDTGLVANGKVTYTATSSDIPDTMSYTGSEQTIFTLKAKYSSTASTSKPVTNLGNFIKTATVANNDGNVSITNITDTFSATAANYEAALGLIPEVTNKSLGSASFKLCAGKRKRFWYVGEDCTTTIDNAFIRSTATGHGNDFSSTTITKDLAIPQGTKRVMLAVAGSKTLTSVIDVDGMGLDIKDKFSSKTISVEGANGYTATDYTVFVFENSNGMDKSTFKIS